MGRTLTRIVAREVAGGYVKVQAVKASRSRVRIYASIGLSYYPFREQNVLAMYDSVRAVLPAGYRKARIELYTDRHEVSELIPMACRNHAALEKLLKKRRLIPFVNPSERPLVTPLDRPAVPTRGLAGRHIALWQSHGRYFDQTRNCWRWQRSRLWMTCEDLYTQSYVLPYLVPMLENAGANVLLPRERDVQKHEVRVSGKSVELTLREFELLRCLLEHKGQVMTRDMLLEKVWGYDFSGETNTVDVYVRFLRSKIDEKFGVKLIHTVRGVGYQIREAE